MFFSIDYFHLYFFMDGKFKQAQKDTWIYVGFDLLVAMLMFIAFKYAEANNFIVVWAIAIIPFCFLVYSIKLNYNVAFYICYSLGSILFANLFQFIFDTKNESETLVLVFLIATTITYGIYVLIKAKDVEKL